VLAVFFVLIQDGPSEAPVWLQLLKHCGRFSECQPLIFEGLGQQLVEQQEHHMQELAAQQQQIAELQEQLAANSAHAAAAAATAAAEAAAEAGELRGRVQVLEGQVQQLLQAMVQHEG